MKIKKLGHCCLVITENNVTFITDPGTFTVAQNDIVGIHVILITHEHRDHLHIDSLKKVLANNPEAQVITNGSVGKLLEKENIKYTVVDDGKKISVKGVEIAGLGTIHDEVYSKIPRVENTGYLVGGRLFYPGDALYDPKIPVDILALPVAGPWLKMSEVLEYALAVKPAKAFPVHDGMMNELGMMLSNMPQKFLSEAGIEFMALELGMDYEL